MGGLVHQFQHRLESLEGTMEDFLCEFAQLVSNMEQKKLQIDTEMQALRQELTVVCLGTVADLAHRALHRVESVVAAEREQLQRMQQQVMEPLESSRMAAYDSLRTMHKDCQLCKNKEACAKGRALLIMRDLLVLTVAFGRGPMSPSMLKEALGEALSEGCGRSDLNKVEQSQLTLAFNKVIALGRSSREDFDAKIGAANLYGPGLTAEEKRELFLVYSACARASPLYVSKNKESRKHGKRSVSPHLELPVSAPVASASGVSAPVSDAQETMGMWQVGASVPFLHGWGEEPSLGSISFDAAQGSSQMCPHMPEAQPCEQDPSAWQDCDDTLGVFRC